MENFRNYLNSCGTLLTEVPNLLDRLREPDLALVSRIVRAFADDPPMVDDEAEETVLRVLLASESDRDPADVERWQVAAAWLVFAAIREAERKEQTDVLVDRATALWCSRRRSEENPPEAQAVPAALSGGAA